MCLHCDTPATPVEPLAFLAGLPRDPTYRTRRGCLWLAYVAAQPAGTPPPVGRNDFYRVARIAPGVAERRRKDGAWFVGVAIM